MRWLVVAAIAVLSSFGINASESVADEATVAEEAAAPSADAVVTVTPIPMPAPVIEVLKPVNPTAKLRSAKKLRLAKTKAFPKTLLSRTERHQMALLATSPKVGEQQVRKHLRDENDGETGYDDLVLHRSFSQPKLVAESDDNDVDVIGLTDTVKLRLLIARMKAVEAHALAQMTDQGDDLSESVKLRLFMARMRAVQAHQNNFT